MMMVLRSSRIGWVALLAMLAAPAVAQDADPTPEQYVEHVGNGAYIVEPGQLTISGRRMICGRRPTVVDPNLDDYGAAYPGFLIVNSEKLESIPPAVAMWIFSHECGHQFRGQNESTADCFATQRGRRQGWLTPAGLDEICNFISPAAGDVMHFSGPRRCEVVRKCFGDSAVE